VDLDSVRYFIKYAITDFEVDIKEYFGRKLNDFRDKLSFDPAVFEACKDISRDQSDQ